ncbi:MAG: nucleotidyltransferase family protein, partial [Candidatus Promineifilaceae bacterium]
AELLGRPARRLAPPDLLLSLVVHLVKHAVYLPAAVERPDLGRVILADGMLLNYLDIAEVMRHYGARLDWEQTVARAQAWGAAEGLGAALRAVGRMLGVAAPAEVLAELPAAGPGRAGRLVYGRLADHLVATHLGLKPNPLWRFLLGYNEGLVLRPVRLLDGLAYLRPPADFLRRRYGRAGLGPAAGHCLRALGQLGRAAADALYYSLDYHLRLKRKDAARGFRAVRAG